MSNLIDIQGQIEKLQKQANEIKAKQFHSTVQEIQSKMQAFGITVKDLQGGKPAKASKAGRKKSDAVVVKKEKPAKSARPPVLAKYRGPNGEEWTGRGLTPRWLATLIAEGQSKDSFLINA